MNTSRPTSALAVAALVLSVFALPLAAAVSTVVGGAVAHVVTAAGLTVLTFGFALGGIDQTRRRFRGRPCAVIALCFTVVNIVGVLVLVNAYMASGLLTWR